MKKFSVSTFLFLFFTILLLAQSPDKVLLVVNGEKITDKEFLKVFSKNNTSTNYSEAELREYLDLYINFRLKVVEAISLKLDTSSTFISELSGYRKQLAMPYLSKNEILDKLVKQTHDRLQYDLRASHVLIRVSQYASPKDTLVAYRKAVEARNKALKTNSFEKVVLEYSEDPSAKDQINDGGSKIPGNYGDLGYFSSLDLVNEFENVAYSMKVGEISLPIRTEYGYHVIKLTEKRPSLGRVQTSHILISVSSNATDEQKSQQKKKAEDVYQKILEGEPFEEMAKLFSDDKGSGMRGGQLPWFGSYRMVPEFIKPIYDMKIGDIYGPVETYFGYHIIKLNDRKEVAPFNEMQHELKSKIIKDIRFQIAINDFAELIKKQNNFVENKKEYNQVLAAVNDSIFTSNWKAPLNFNATLFSVNERKFTQQEFLSFIEINQLVEKGDDKNVFVKKMYEEFVKQSLLNYENDNLEIKYPEFAALMKEYHDGILLFELTDQMVWSKALRDTVGLEMFYNKIKNNHKYPPRTEAEIYVFNDIKSANAAHKLIDKNLKKNRNYTKALSDFKTKNNIEIKEEKGIYVREDHSLLKNLNNLGVNKPIEFENRFYVIIIKRLLEPEPRPLNEIKGIVANEYQNYLEQQWVNDLRMKYSWTVNEDVLKSLIK